MDYGDYIVYVDESGDHGLASIDSSYPVFVLAFCIFEKSIYSSQVVPAVQSFKFRYFGHDMAILHEHAIRKAKGDFAFLVNSGMRESFMHDLTQVVDDAPFTIIASCIDKAALLSRYTAPANPYELALVFGIERLHAFLKSKRQETHLTHIVAESRGPKEDSQLELEFRRICDGANYKRARMPFDILFAPKSVNSCGLQMADLIAHPIGTNLLHPGRVNRAHDVLKKKYFRVGGKIEGWGRKCFP